MLRVHLQSLLCWPKDFSSTQSNFSYGMEIAGPMISQYRCQVIKLNLVLGKQFTIIKQQEVGKLFNSKLRMSSTSDS